MLFSVHDLSGNRAAAFRSWIMDNILLTGSLSVQVEGIGVLAAPAATSCRLCKYADTSLALKSNWALDLSAV